MLGTPDTSTITPTTTINGATTTNTTNSNTLQGAASDESGAQAGQTPAAIAAAEDKLANATPLNITDPSSNAPEKPEAQRENTPAQNNTKGEPPYENETFIRTENSANNRPGKRLKNPLSYMSSYNYQLSLYIITPDAYDAFLASGRKNINVFNEKIGSSSAAEKANRKGGAFLLAQSGGAGPDPRAPGVKYDYYIDNLSFRHTSSTKSSGAPTGNIEFKFQITEPYGFSFINNLKQAQKEFDSYSTGAAWGTAEQKITSVPIAKQFFILGIRFFGWDARGRQVKGDETFEGSTLDPGASGTGGLFETFYELTVHSIKYKIDGKATVYDMEGNVTGASLGSNIKRGFINSPKEVYGYTVRDSISGPKGLLTMLNKEQQDLKDNGTVEYPVTYKIKWLGSDAERIALATLVSEARQDKSNQTASQAQNTKEVNDATGTKASPNKTQEKISFGQQPIIQALDTIFSRSKYVEDALAFNYTDANEFNPETKSKDAKDTAKRPLRWYRITPNISNPKWDSKIRDWSYDITYEIQTYLMPVIDSPFAVKTDNYYGPHKRYDYWYTGENTEILSYVQQLNNQYLNEVPAGSPANKSTENNEGNAQKTAVNPNSTKSTDLATGGGGLETAAAGSIKNVLYDPGSYTSATIQILGDPDFLMQENGTGTDRFYDSNGTNPYSIKPTGGQVFIEIDFKEPVDYSANKTSDIVNNEGEGVTGVGGTMAINDSILFWDYPAGAKKVIKGISYEVITVRSSFRNGLFTQTIEAVINDFGRGAKENDKSRESGTSGGVTNQEEQAVGTAEAEADKAEGTTPDAKPGTGQPAKPQTNTPAPEATT